MSAKHKCVPVLTHRLLRETEQACEILQHLKQFKRSQVCAHSLQQRSLNTRLHIATENCFVFLTESHMSQAYSYVSSIVTKAVRWQYTPSYS